MSNEKNQEPAPAPCDVRVYRCGIFMPHEDDRDAIFEQMRAAHRYRNTLVEIERHRRTAIRSLLASQNAELERAVADADAALVLAIERAQKEKGAARSAIASPERRAEISELRGKKRAAIDALRAARAAGRPQMKEGLDRIEELALALRKNARQYCATYWGSYLLVEQSDESARKLPLYALGRPADPHFARFDSAPKQLGVQIQGGMTVAELLSGEDTRLRLTPRELPAGADPTSKRSLRRVRKWLHLRIGSNPDRSPIFARFALVMHRELPENARIKTCKVCLSTYGTHEKWSALFTVEIPTLALTTGKGKVGIDLGWRVLPTGIRVGKWFGEDGAQGEILLPLEIRDRLEKADSLRAIRDRLFDEARSRLRTFLLGAETVPQWLADATRSLAEWRSFGRMASLVHRWRLARFEGDAEVFGALEAWRTQDEHLWDWEANQRRKTLLARREIYRIAAAHLARRYASVVLEKFDLRAVTENPPPERDKSDNVNARSTRFVAAPSELRLAVRQAFLSRGGTVELVDAAYTTRICAACGSVEEWDQARDIRHACGGCGAEWDQDDNAARNILSRSSDAPEAPRSHVGRWQKRRAEGGR